MMNNPESACDEAQEKQLKLYMFFGLLNLKTLSTWMPVEIDGAEVKDTAQKRKHLETMSTALTCQDYQRVFGSRHASIKHIPGEQIRSFGCLLTPEQEEVCDNIESLGFYYEKIKVSVMLHPKDGGEDRAAEAYVYKMLDCHIQQDVEEGLTHENDNYVR
mgnify:CR=1 FL=1